jgi:putative transposase
MSTHEHLIVTDTQGRMPDFLRDFHRTVAHGVKHLRKWDGAVWENEPTSRVEICTSKAMIEELAYLMANPVEAGLVDNAEHWPSVMVLPEELGNKTWTIERPDFFFDPDNSEWPRTATLRLTMPKTHVTNEEVRSRVRDELNQLEAKARERVQARRWRVLGRIGVLEASPYSRAKSWEPLRSLNPNFAVGRGQKSAFFRAVQALRTFRNKYRNALEQWRQGIRDVLFPKHTWQMSWLHAVQVESG